MEFKETVDPFFFLGGGGGATCNFNLGLLSRILYSQYSQANKCACSIKHF